MNQIEVQYQEILYILDKLLANLGLVLEDYDAEYLTQADLYIEIFKIMFPALEHDLNADFGEDVTDEDLIQYLVNILAKDIIKMDLGHIRGELIAQGDAKSILNFLQLLFEISNMIGAEKSRDKGDKKSKKKKKEVRSFGNSVDQGSDHSQKSSMEIRQKYHSAQGITAEFSSSAEGESNLEGQSGRESYMDENGDAYYNEAQISENLMQNKAIYEQQKNLKQDSRSVSRISEVSKSKESSEYDKGAGSKKLSQKFDDFNPGGLHKRGVGQNGAKHGSYASDDRREKIHYEKEEEEALEEYGEEEGNEYGLQHEPGFTEESMHAHEEEGVEDHPRVDEGEEGDYMDEQEYIPAEGEDEVVEEGDNDYSAEDMRKISGDGETEDVEYYTNDPINYQPMGKGNSKLSYEAEKEEISRRNMPSEAKIQRYDAHEQEEEYYGQEEEYEGQTGEYGEHQEYEEQEEYIEQEEEEREQIEDDREYEEEREELPEGQLEMDPRHMEYVDGMEEVVEEHDEDNYDEESYGDRRGQIQYEQETVGHVQQAVKSKGKAKGKAKAAGKKKKSTSKAIDDYTKGKVQHRPLKPATAGMKVKRDKKSETKKSTARKSDDSASTQRSKKLIHSKSERNLNVAEEQEPSHSQLNEEYSEDRGLAPMEYQQHEEGQQEEEQEYQEGNEGQEEYAVQEEVDQIPDGNVFKILSDNVMRVKENLRENRAIEEIPYDDERTAKLIMQQKNQYKQYLKDFMKDHQLREKKYETMRQLGQKNFFKKMRSEKAKDDNMRKDFENQQKSLYFKMRDEKVNYLRRVHKTIFELEKKRIIEDKKEYIEFRTSRNKEAQNMIDSIKNEYKNKLSTLRERNQNQQTERKIANEAQRAFIQAFEKELKMDQMKEVERLKNKWRHEKEKFDMMIKDEGFLERKIMELYKKGHF